jgi:hypothetical protein
MAAVVAVQMPQQELELLEQQQLQATEGMGLHPPLQVLL